MFHENIKKLTRENTNFRKVIHTGDQSQLVLMCLQAGEEIGEETHTGVDQILFLIEGEGKAVVDGMGSEFKGHDVVFVPAGVKHNFINTGKEYMKLFTVYSPPVHADGIVEKTKPQGEEIEYSKLQGSLPEMYENI